MIKYGSLRIFLFTAFELDLQGAMIKHGSLRIILFTTFELDLPGDYFQGCG